eukprot:gnl/Chilomastix_cuspidata/3950.p1 GENE.gnl/Chilomastix_cuspidata/3950~~gnl/Chilomastix_cuspidata/3950.p1  ORF type:complete len:3196 (+),score=658.47 gnl/Chilomastix_cuspidata/3950:75-9662(+)
MRHRVSIVPLILFLLISSKSLSCEDYPEYLPFKGVECETTPEIGFQVTHPDKWGLSEFRNIILYLETTRFYKIANSDETTLYNVCHEIPDGAAVDPDTYYPSSIPAGYVYGGPVALSRRLPSDTYTCSFNGTGALEFAGATSVEAQGGVYTVAFASEPVPITDHNFSTSAYRHADSGELFVFISSTSAEDPVRDLRCVPADDGLAPSDVFSAEFRAAAADFDVVWTGEWETEPDWGAGSAPVSLSERVAPRLYYAPADPLPVQYYAALAAETGKRLAVVLPGAADAAFVADLRQLWTVSGIGQQPLLTLGRAPGVEIQPGHLAATLDRAGDWPEASWGVIPPFDNYFPHYLSYITEGGLEDVATERLDFITLSGALGSTQLGGAYAYDNSTAAWIEAMVLMTNDELLSQSVNQKFNGADAFYSDLAMLSAEYGVRILPLGAGLYLKPKTYGARFHETSAAASEGKLEGRMARLCLGLLEAENGPPLQAYIEDWLDKLWRIGARLLIGPKLTKRVEWCETENYINEQCGAQDVFAESMDKVRTSHRYKAFVHWKETLQSPLEAERLGAGTAAEACCSSTCVWGACNPTTCLCECFAGYSDAACTLLDENWRDSSSRAEWLGLNPGNTVDYSSELATRDLMKRARTWIYGAAGFGDWAVAEPALVSDYSIGGYPAFIHPGRRVRNLLIRDLECHGPNSGTYVLLWDGEGAITLGMDAKVTGFAPGRFEFELSCTTDMNNGLFMQIYRVDPSNPIRNIRVFLKADEPYAAAFPYNNVWLSELSRVSTVRFMDLQRTNSGTDTGADSEWATRKSRPQHFTWNEGSGIPVEDIVAVSNLLGSDPWVNVGHLWDDDFVSNFAAYMAENLRPDLRVYVELSNELWSAGFFPSGGYAISAASQPGQPWKYSEDDQQMALCWYAKRSLEVWALFRAAFGGGSARVLRVAAGQVVTVWPSRKMYTDVTTESWWEGDYCLGDFSFYLNTDAYAVAPYLGYEVAGLEDYSDEQIDAFISSTIPSDLLALEADLLAHVGFLDQMEVATGHRPSLVAYESAISYTNYDEVTEDQAAKALHGDPRMEQVQRDYWETLRKHMDLIIQFGTNGFPWALAEHPGTRAASVKHAVFEELTGGPYPACGNGTLHAPGGVPDSACLCPYGRTGADCSEYIEVVYDYCHSCDMCLEKRPYADMPFVVEKYCECTDGWQGETCKVPICEGNCNNFSGDCIGPGVCSCYNGFRGEGCSEDCGCNGFGSCNDQGTCDCDENWIYDEASSSCVWDCPGRAAGTSCGGPGFDACTRCVWGDCVEGECVCYAGYYGASCEQSGGWAPNQGQTRLGMNLPYPADYYTHSVFTDLFLTARDWVTQEDTNWVRDPHYIWSTNDERVTFTEDGYPSYIPDGVVVSTLMMRDVGDFFPAGLHVVRWDGRGKLQFGMGSELLEMRQGVAFVQYTPLPDDLNNGFLLTIAQTDPSDPVRNIRVVPSEFARTYHLQPWTPEFLDRISSHGTLRVMNWLSYLDDTTWESRTPNRLELVIDVANRIGADLWLNLPYGADDSYMRGCAQLFLSGLRPEVKVYIEGSGNENWSPATDAGLYALTKGTELGLDTDIRGDNCWYGQDMCVRMRFTALRTYQIWRIWEAEWGFEAGRIIRVAPGWLDTYNGNLLSYQHTSMPAPFGELADALAVTGYWDCGGLSDDATLMVAMGTEWAKEQCRSEGWRDRLMEQTETHRVTAELYGLDLLFYESGPILVDNNWIQGGLVTDHANEIYEQVAPTAASAYSDVLAALSVSKMMHYEMGYNIYNTSMMDDVLHQYASENRDTSYDISDALSSSLSAFRLVDSSGAASDWIVLGEEYILRWETGGHFATDVLLDGRVVASTTENMWRFDLADLPTSHAFSDGQPVEISAIIVANYDTATLTATVRVPSFFGTQSDAGFLVTYRGLAEAPSSLRLSPSDASSPSPVPCTWAAATALAWTCLFERGSPEYPDVGMRAVFSTEAPAASFSTQISAPSEAISLATEAGDALGPSVEGNSVVFVTASAPLSLGAAAASLAIEHTATFEDGEVGVVVLLAGETLNVAAFSSEAGVVAQKSIEATTPQVTVVAPSAAHPSSILVAFTGDVVPGVDSITLLPFSASRVARNSGRVEASVEFSDENVALASVSGGLDGSYHVCASLPGLGLRCSASATQVSASAPVVAQEFVGGGSSLGAVTSMIHHRGVSYKSRFLPLEGSAVVEAGPSTADGGLRLVTLSKPTSYVVSPALGTTVLLSNFPALLGDAVILGSELLDVALFPPVGGAVALLECWNRSAAPAALEERVVPGGYSLGVRMAACAQEAQEARSGAGTDGEYVISPPFTVRRISSAFNVDVDAPESSVEGDDIVISWNTNCEDAFAATFVAFDEGAPDAPSRYLGGTTSPSSSAVLSGLDAPASYLLLVAGTCGSFSFDRTRRISISPAGPSTFPAWAYVIIVAATIVAVVAAVVAARRFRICARSRSVQTTGVVYPEYMGGNGEQQYYPGGAALLNSPLPPPPPPPPRGPDKNAARKGFRSLRRSMKTPETQGVFKSLAAGRPLKTVRSVNVKLFTPLCLLRDFPLDQLRYRFSLWGRSEVAERRTPCFSAIVYPHNVILALGREQPAPARLLVQVEKAITGEFFTYAQAVFPVTADAGTATLSLASVHAREFTAVHECESVGDLKIVVDVVATGARSLTRAVAPMLGVMGALVEEAVRRTPSPEPEAVSAEMSALTPVNDDQDVDDIMTAMRTRALNLSSETVGERVYRHALRRAFPATTLRLEAGARVEVSLHLRASDGDVLWVPAVCMDELAKHGVSLQLPGGAPVEEMAPFPPGTEFEDGLATTSLVTVRDVTGLPAASVSLACAAVPRQADATLENLSELLESGNNSASVALLELPEFLPVAAHLLVAPARRHMPDVTFAIVRVNGIPVTRVVSPNCDGLVLPGSDGETPSTLIASCRSPEVSLSVSNWGSEVLLLRAHFLTKYAAGSSQRFRVFVMDAHTPLLAVDLTVIAAFCKEHSVRCLDTLRFRDALDVRGEGLFAAQILRSQHKTRFAPRAPGPYLVPVTVRQGRARLLMCLKILVHRPAAVRNSFLLPARCDAQGAQPQLARRRRMALRFNVPGDVFARGLYLDSTKPWLVEAAQPDFDAAMVTVCATITVPAFTPLGHSETAFLFVPNAAGGDCAAFELVVRVTPPAGAQ